MQRTLVAIPALNESATIGGVIEEVRAGRARRRHPRRRRRLHDTTASAARRAGAQVGRCRSTWGSVGRCAPPSLRAAQRLRRSGPGGRRRPAHRRPHPRPARRPGRRLRGRRRPVHRHGDYSVRGPRRWAMRSLARSLSRVCRSNLTDTTSGFRAADRRAIALFARHYPAEYLGDTVESLVIAARAGLPVVTRSRSRCAAPGRHGQPVADPRHALPGRALLALYVALPAGRSRSPTLEHGRVPDERQLGGPGGRRPAAGHS